MLDMVQRAGAGLCRTRGRSARLGSRTRPRLRSSKRIVLVDLAAMAVTVARVLSERLKQKEYNVINI